MGFIYKITNPNKMIYVGKTYNVKNRISDYRCRRYRSKKSIIIDSIIKYGWNNHSFEIIEEVADELMNEREIFWIKELNTYAYENVNGMNLTRGGDGQRHSWKSDADRVAKAKMRRGENAPTYGKILSEEVRMKIAKSVSDYNKANRVSPSKKAHELSRLVRYKKVVCYNLSGIFIGEYNSIREAADVLGINRRTANDALNGKQKHAHSVLFRHRTENYPTKIDVSGINFFVRKNYLERPHIEGA